MTWHQGDYAENAPFAAVGTWPYPDNDGGAEEAINDLQQRRRKREENNIGFMRILLLLQPVVVANICAKVLAFAICFDLEKASEGSVATCDLFFQDVKHLIWYTVFENSSLTSNVDFFFCEIQIILLQKKGIFDRNKTFGVIFKLCVSISENCSHIFLYRMQHPSFG